MLREALAFPRRDDGWLRTVAIGGVLSLLGVLVLPAVLVSGYLLRVLRAAVEGDESPPRFEGWLGLLVDGVLVWVVQFVYVGLPTLLLLGVLGSFAVVTTVVTSPGAAPLSSGDAGAATLAAVVVFAGLVGLLLVATFLLPAALANLARTGDVASAFHLRLVARAAFSPAYVVAYLLAVVVGVVLGLAGGVLLLVLVGAFVLFYAQVVVYHLLGEGFARGLGLDPGAGETVKVG